VLTGRGGQDRTPAAARAESLANSSRSVTGEKRFNRPRGRHIHGLRRPARWPQQMITDPFVTRGPVALIYQWRER
jgi:hypothetical protein